MTRSNEKRKSLQCRNTISSTIRHIHKKGKYIKAQGVSVTQVSHKARKLFIFMVQHKALKLKWNRKTSSAFTWRESFCFFTAFTMKRCSYSRAIEISVCFEIWIQWEIIYSALQHTLLKKNNRDKGRDYRTKLDLSVFYDMAPDSHRDLISSDTREFITATYWHFQKCIWKWVQLAKEKTREWFRKGSEKSRIYWSCGDSLQTNKFLWL